jgi:hypothetical protein
MKHSKLKIDETKSTTCSIGGKNVVYYVDGQLVKTLEVLQDGVDERKKVESFDKRSGHRRQLDYGSAKWLNSVVEEEQ